MLKKKYVFSSLLMLKWVEKYPETTGSSVTDNDIIKYPYQYKYQFYEISPKSNDQIWGQPLMG